MTKHLFSVLVLLAACSPFASATGTNAPPPSDGGTNADADADGKKRNDSGEPDAGTKDEGGEGEDSGPASTPLTWEGDEVSSWQVSNVAPFTNETNDCCGACQELPLCGFDNANDCNHTAKQAAGGIGTFVSGPAVATETHSRNGLYAWRTFDVTPMSSYVVSFSFKRLSTFGHADSAQYRVKLYDGDKEVNSTPPQSLKCGGGECFDDVGDERMISRSSVEQNQVTVVISLFATSNCAGTAGVAHVEADINYVRLTLVP